MISCRSNRGYLIREMATCFRYEYICAYALSFHWKRLNILWFVPQILDFHSNIGRWNWGIFSARNNYGNMSRQFHNWRTCIKTSIISTYSHLQEYDYVHKWINTSTNHMPCSWIATAIDCVQVGSWCSLYYESRKRLEWRVISYTYSYSYIEYCRSF